jgi:hypothetical protein
MIDIIFLHLLWSRRKAYSVFSDLWSTAGIVCEEQSLRALFKAIHPANRRNFHLSCILAEVTATLDVIERYWIATQLVAGCSVRLVANQIRSSGIAPGWQCLVLLNTRKVRCECIA